MSRINGFKFLILIWCVCLLTRTVYLSSIKKKYQNDEDTITKLKNILLRKLDLDEEPTNLGDTNVPTYLLDLFETNSLFENNRILLLDNSNTIRSHPIFNDNSQHTFKPQNRSGFLIKFNVTLPKKEMLNAGEFRLYLNISSLSKCTSNRQRITINQIIQQLVDPFKKQSINSTFNRNDDKADLTDPMNGNQFINQYLTQANEDQFIYRQIDSLVSEQDESKWLQFDVNPAVESWIKKTSQNYGLLIKSHCVDQNDFNFNENLFIDNLIFESSNSDQYDNFKPCLLTYSNFQNADFEAENNNNPLDFINKKKRHVNQDINQDLKLTSVKKQDCSIYSMYVDFREIGWDDWLISPRGYDGFFCYGDCSLSVIRNGNTTNHATMQSLSNGIQPDIPPPCCIPSEYGSITMIYKDKETSVLKIYENMIVKKCNCL